MIHLETALSSITKEDIDRIKIINDFSLISESKYKVGGIYFMHDGRTLTKIGCSEDIKSRVLSLNNSQPKDLIPLGFLEVVERKGVNIAENIECLLHNYCKNFKYKGEWFLTNSDKTIFEDCVSYLKSINHPINLSTIDYKEGRKRLNLEEKTAPSLKTVMADNSISIEAKGFYALLYVQPNFDELDRHSVIEMCGCSKHKYDRFRKELVAAGYLNISPCRIGGKIAGYDWSIDIDNSQSLNKIQGTA